MWEIYQVHSELLQTIYVRTAEQAEAVRAGRQPEQLGSRAAKQPGSQAAELCMNVIIFVTGAN